MAPKKRKQQQKQPAPKPAEKKIDGFNQHLFEAEVNELKEKAQKQQSSNSPRDYSVLASVLKYLKVLALLALLAVYSNVSTLNLSPVYGSLPSSIWHSRQLTMACFVGWAGNAVLRDALPVRTAQALPLIAVFIPMLQYNLFQFSEVLGATWGPVATELVTLCPLAVVSAACVADAVEDSRMTMLPGFLSDGAPGILSWAVFRTLEKLFGGFIMPLMGKSFVFTRIGLQMVLSTLYCLFAPPSKYLVFASLPLLHTAFLNMHSLSPMTTKLLNSTLQADGWLLLDRRESLTGYLSVIENKERGFRVMRCDHSILGGEWVNYRGDGVTEPIYGVFAMLEAVRLVETTVHVPDDKASALVIGLGVGTTPSALVSHGINTTVVEIDPTVRDLALQYFDLKENMPAVIQDAVGYVDKRANREKTKRYDYIIHDVFTGGAEPAELFTLEFLWGLSRLLKKEGVIAINYAGDFSLPTPRVVLSTINQIFPTCRIFREMLEDKDSTSSGAADFTNMVIFCKKTTTTPLTFRKAVENDFLKSHARQMFLEPKHEVMQDEFLRGGDVGVLRTDEIIRVAKWQQQSALGHWKIMRTVLPAKVWEKW